MEKLSDTDIPQFAVFDTSFHTTIPPEASTLPLPFEYRSEGVRKYGFHGTSVRYVAKKANERLRQLHANESIITNTGDNNGRKNDRGFNLIVAHIGNGASVTAVSSTGKSVETSMGFTPTSGLMMGTRAGDVDPAIVGFAVEHIGNKKKSIGDVMDDINKRSGLLGIAGKSDMREALEMAAKSGKGNGNDCDSQDAKLAVDMFTYRIAKQISASAVALPGKLDAIVFTAGIGEHSNVVRSKCIAHLKSLFNIELDRRRNDNDGADSNGLLTKDGSWPAVLDIATEEEIMIAQDCLRLMDRVEGT